MIGALCVTHWCRGQAVIALSSGEAEYYSLVTLVAEMCGANSLAKDWNLDYKFGINMDATAAIGMASRRGLGRVKHVHTVFLWVQERLQEHKAVVKKTTHYRYAGRYPDQVSLARNAGEAVRQDGVRLS